MACLKMITNLKDLLKSCKISASNIINTFLSQSCFVVPRKNFTENFVHKYLLTLIGAPLFTVNTFAIPFTI